MFVILLRFSANKENTATYLDGHKAWLQKGFDDGVFLVAGSLAPAAGGALLAHNLSAAEVEERVGLDPFVQNDVVRAEIIEFAPGMVDERLTFLKS